MADLDRIKRNVSKMAAQGAPVEDIDGYIQSEGVSLEQVRNHKPGNMVQRAVSGVVDMVRGKEDPAYKGLPDLIGARDTLPAAARQSVAMDNPLAKTVAVDDAAYADTLKKSLGDNFVRQEKDANGYPVIVYRDKDGQEAKAYANRPGLDWQDVDRGVSAAMPYVVGANLVGKLSKGMGLGKRVIAQGLAGGAVSTGQDIAASGMGSEQGIDPVRAGMAAGLGGAAELASPVFQMGKNLLGFGTKYVDDAGRLTAEGRTAAKQAGVDPADLDPETAKAFGEGLRDGIDPKEVLAAVRTNRFGIPTTKGQRTKDPELLSLEKDIRYGNMGGDAKQTLEQLDRQQAQAIKDQIRGYVTPGRSGEFKGVGATIAPTRLPQEQSPQIFGQSVRDGLRGAKEAIDEQGSKVWGEVPDYVPKPESLDSLSDALSGRLGAFRLDSRNTPTAMDMDAELLEFVKGKAITTDGPKLIKQTPVRTIDELRRRLLTISKAAAPGSPDAKASKAIYDGFNDWIWDTAPPEVAGKMQAAREFTKEVKDLFEPTRNGTKTPAARIISQVMDEADSPERVITALLGDAGPRTTPKPGVIDALTRIKAILNKGGNQAGDMAAKETWNDIRMAYWLKLTTNKRGEPLSPTMLSQGIDEAFQNQSTLLKTLFSDKEMAEFRAFARAVSEAAYKDPNPSGTASALRTMMRGEGGSLLKTGLEAQANRELFSKHNVMMSRIYRMLAKKVPVDVMGSRDAMGRAAARKVASQKLTKRPTPTTGQFGSIYGSQSYQDEGQDVNY